MKIYKVGDTEQVICEQCQALKEAEFQLRNVPLSDNSGMVKNVLVGVCRQCDSVAVLPHQSVPAVKQQLETQRKAIESRLPAHMVDILNLACFELGGNTDFVPSLVKFYIHSLCTQSIPTKNITQYLQTDLATGKAQKRLSLKGRRIADEIAQLKTLTNISSTTDLIKSVVLKINDDLFVHPNNKTIRTLKGIIAAVA